MRASGLDEWKRYLSFERQRGGSSEGAASRYVPMRFEHFSVPSTNTRMNRKRPPLFRKQMDAPFLLVLCIYTLFAVIVGVSVERMRGRGIAGHLELILAPATSRRLTDETTSTYDDDDDDLDRMIEDMRGNQDDRAIYLVSMGEKADDISLVQRCLISIRRKGNWQGYVVVLTNVKFQKMYQEKLGRIDTYLYGDDSHVIALHPTFEQLQDTLANAKRDSMKIKRFKTRALDVLEQDSRLDAVKMVIYMDIDIVVGRDLNSFLRHAEKKYGVAAQTTTNKDESSKLALFEDKAMPLHGGIMVMARNSSEFCLQKWREEQDKNPLQAYDQVALLHMYNQNQKGRDTRCKVVQMQRGKHLVFPNEGYMTRKINTTEPFFRTFVHVTNNHRAGKISTEVQTEFFVKILELTKEEKSGIASLLGSMIKAA